MRLAPKTLGRTRRFAIVRRMRSPLLPLLFALFCAVVTTPAAEPRHVLLVGQGPDGHPTGTHEFMLGVQLIDKLLAPYKGQIETTIVKADEPWAEGPGLIDKADGIVFMVTQGAQWMQNDPQRFAAFQRFCARQGALVALHWSIGAKDAQYIPGQLALLGGTRGGTQRKYKVLERDVHLVEPAHPVLAGMKDFKIDDEWYYHLDLQPPSPGFHPLFSVNLDDKDETVCWAWDRPDGGRSFGFVGIHFHKNWERIEYRRLVSQAILWSLKLPIPEGGLKDEQLAVMP